MDFKRNELRKLIPLTSSILVGLITYFTLRIIPSSDIVTYEVVENQSSKDVSLLKDLDADGDHELITKGYHRNGFATIYIKDGSDGVYQHNFKSEWLDDAALFYGDYNRNGIMEVYGFQYSEDSLFISGVEYPKRVILNRKFVITGFTDIKSTTTSGSILSIRENEKRRMVLSIMGGFGARPRNVCLYDFDKDEWTYSQDSIKAHQQFSTSFDLDQDGVNEIITWGRSPDNNHGGEYFSDQNSYIITFDENLEIKDWYEAKGLSSNTIFIVLGGKPYFILNHFDQSPRSDVYSYQNINQASILFKLGPDARISHIFSDQDQSYYIKTANDASQYLVKVKEDFSESATYAIPENLYFISNSPNIEEDYNFLIFRDKSTRDLFYAKRPGAILEPVQEVSAQGTLLFSQGVYHTKETLVMSGSTGDFFFDLSASELRTYWEIPAAIIMSLLTFFGHAVLLRHGSAKSKSSNSKILKINTRTGFEIIPLEDILYCKADGKYTAIQTTDKQFLNVILSIVLSLLFLTGCNKSDDKILPETESVKGTVSLGVNIQNSEKSGNGRVTNDPIPAAMLITIKASDGQIIYSLEKLTLVEVNGSYVSTTIELDTGSYTIEDFIITDANDTSIYITPKTGSGFEDLVSTPLPFEFEVLPDEMTKVGLDVVSVSLGQTSDFGYAEFTFNVVDLKAGLVAYYPFNGNANDESENENDGTVNGATLTSDRHGNSNSAYDFSGAGGYSSPAIDIPRAPELEPTNAITVSAWVNPDNYENTGIVCKRNSANGRPYNSYSISFGGDKKFSFTVSTTATGDDGYGLIQKTDFEYGTWNHVVGTYDGSKVSLYVNGVLETDTVASGSIVYSSLDLYFGRTGASNYTYDGRLDEVRIYNRALKPAEIKVLSEY